MDDSDACEIVEEYDPVKDFAKRKPSWCGGGLVVKEYNDCTKYYANFHGGCGEQHFELEEDQPTDGIPMIVNSTELRSIVPAADLEEVSDGIWRLSRTAEEEALSWCR